MKLEDIKIGMKVVPHSKSAGDTDFNHCFQWNTAKSRQKFLYVTDIEPKGITLHFKVNQNKAGNLYLPSDLEPYQEPTMTITQEQFDNLKEGDALVSDKCTGEDKEIIFQGRLGQVGLFLTSNFKRSWMLSFQEVIENAFRIVIKPENYQGFTLGDYSDKIVVVAVSNTSAKDCQKMEKIGILSHVGKDYFALKGMVTKWTYAQLINTTPFQLV